MTAGAYSYNLGMHFSEVAEANARRPALRYAERDVLYSDLMHWVEGLAALLLGQGLQRGVVIAIGHCKHPLSYALMHAALRLGITYVVIDVETPIERTSRILRVSKAALLFYDDPGYESAMQALASACQCRLHLLAEDQLHKASAHERESQLQHMRQVDGATIAYVMFTSGSTGTPKGVAVTHQNLLHFIAWGQQYFGVSERDNFANLSPMYFDNSVFDFYVGMFSGAALTPIPRKMLARPYELVPYVGNMACTIWFSVPSLLIYLMAMKAIPAGSMTALRRIVFGGEGYPKVELKKLYCLFADRAKLVNVYGPTECTCICSAYTLTDEDFIDLTGLPTLGHLNPNFDYRIVDEEGNDAASGELCLIGPNVAAGYFNDLERTAASFLTLTEPGRFMKRMYRTGDLVQETEGKLYFVGRKDNQIKHMGYRIELEEIEHALIRLPFVDQAAVVYHRTSATHGKLIGFVACTGVVEERAMLLQLADLLPDYMVPSRLLVMDVLPKNPNGKVDRLQLRSLLDK